MAMYAYARPDGGTGPETVLLERKWMEAEAHRSMISSMYLRQTGLICQDEVVFRDNCTLPIVGPSRILKARVVARGDFVAESAPGEFEPDDM
jgi:hypothetical protein